jgi:DNA repair protein RadA/Sms
MTTEAARFLSSIGLRYRKAADKAVPDRIFRLPADQLRLFLKVLFSCDGSVYVSGLGQAGVSYSTISGQLARDVQHLLLRFGFVSKLRTRPQRVNGRPYVSYEVQLLGLREVKRYLREIGIWGRQAARASIEAEELPRGRSTHFDTVPTGQAFWMTLQAATGGAPLKRISAKAGVHLKNRRHERPLCRSTVAALADAYPSPELRALGHGDVYWDEVVSVAPAGEERVYDLSMPAHHNFVANDLIVHNSTLLLEVAHLLARRGPVLYVSGEESERQIKLRGDRMGVRAPGLLLMSETSLERILDQVDELKPSALVVDSVQTVYSSKFPSAPGSIAQVREVATQLLFLAKGRGLTTFLIGHVTKDGNLAGPKSLEHIVDTVLYFEGEKRQHHRIVRAVKNRFGAVSELGVFEMTGGGLKPVANPSALFLSERQEGSAGSAVVATLEGTRPMLVEVQALVSPTSFGTPRRMSLGIDPNRTSLLLAVLEKRVGLALLGDDVFVSVAGGLEVAEPAADLGVAAAVASSFRNRPLPARTAVFGEVGLAGEVRGVGQAGLRLREAAQMGFTRCLLPVRSLPDPAVVPDGIRPVGVNTLQDALEKLFE